MQVGRVTVGEIPKPGLPGLVPRMEPRPLSIPQKAFK